MNVIVALLTLVLLAAVIAVISAPLRAARKPPDLPSARLAELRAAREAKYREIRDMELDYRTGKLSWEDFEMSNNSLRAEAVEILNSLRELGEDDHDSAELSVSEPLVASRSLPSSQTGVANESGGDA